MYNDKFSVNVKLTEGTDARIRNHVEDGEKIAFVIACDLNSKHKYGEAILCATDRKLFILDEEIKDIPYSELEKIAVKRMYGNAIINATYKTGEVKALIRFTYTVASLCDMAVQFVTQRIEGKSFEEDLEMVEETYEKMTLVCPKCGAALPRAGAECIKCKSKSQMFAKLAKYMKPEIVPLLICVAMSVATTAIALIPPYATAMIVDDVIPNSDKHKLLMIVAVLLGSYIISYVISGFRGYLLRVSGNRIVLNIRNDVYEKAQHLPMKFYDKTSTGSVINRISNDSNVIQQFILKISQDVIVQFFLLIGIIVIMFCMDWKLTLISLAPVPIIVIGAKWFGRKIYPFYRKIWRKWTAVTSVMTDTIPCVRVIKSFAGEERAVNKFNKYNEEWFKVDSASAKITQIYPCAIGFLVTCGSLLIWAIGGHWVIDSNGQALSTGFLVSFISYTSMFYGPVNFFAYLTDSYQAAVSSAERILDILDAEPEPNKEDAIKVDHIKGKIEFRNVNFSFDKTKKVLTDVNFTINAGETIGIVGTTGSGKSTLINLLLRFYDGYDGQILVDDIDLKDYDISTFRSCIGYVQQEPMMFADTIFNNIAYGVPNASVESVINAANVANAHEFIARQPDGYDSMLGERGVGLSGGEKQRLSIARAVLKNPSVLVFDEATAAVDSETEELIQEAIDRLIKGRTTLMIAHRLSTLRKANRIIVVDQGRIIEFGSHDELMALKGKYYKLIEIQSLSEKIRSQKEAENFE